MNKGFIVTCKFCDQESRSYRFALPDVQIAAAAYLTHMVESHWDMLELGRKQRFETGIPVNDAWTRL